MLETPVLFLVFNRPDVTRRVFERIRQVQPKQLFVAADGYRCNYSGEEERCQEVRQIATAVDWNCKVRTLFRDKNLGCREAVSSAISWFFENVEEGIILEDDCLPDISFFYYCSSILSLYRHENKVMHIGGHSIGTIDTNDSENCFFSAYNHIWGWATWKRAWHHYDISMSELAEFLSDESLYSYFDSPQEINFWRRTLSKAIEIDTWDYQWTYSIWKNEGVSVLPKKSIVENIGFEEYATHTKTRNQLVDITEYGAIDNPIVPERILIDKMLDQQMSNSIFNIPVSKSPITENYNVRIEKNIETKEIIASYGNTVGIDVSPYFKGVSQVKLYKCQETGYRFFFPFNISGNGEFYQTLQQNDWYYMPWKWEHQKTLELLQPGMKVLEVGCATGDFLNVLKEERASEVVGLELNRAAAEQAIVKGLNVVIESVEEHSAKNDSSYDLVCSFQVLEHISEIKSFLDAQISCLRKGGKLIICVPNNDSFIKWEQGGALNFPPHHMGWWGRKSLESLSSIFNIELNEIIYEPLQTYHFGWYTKLWVRRYLKLKILRSVFYRLKLIHLLNIYLRIRRLKINGHSVLAIYTKV